MKIKEHRLNAHDEYGSTAVMLAAKNGKLRCLRLLIEGGMDVNATGYNGHYPVTIFSIHPCSHITALHFAARNNHLTELIYMVEEAHANVHVEDTSGNTPLHDAARMGNLECIEVLVNAGADIEHVNKAGITALMAATLNGRIPLVDMLILKKVALNTQDGQGDTALHQAALGGFTRIVQLLLNNNADRTIVNDDGNTPAEVVEGASIEAKALRVLLTPGAIGVARWAARGRRGSDGNADGDGLAMAMAMKGFTIKG